jgi:hypothetical protein
VLVVALAATWRWPSFDDAIESAPIPPVVSVPAPVADPAPIPVIAPTTPPAANPADAAPSASFKLVGTVVTANGADSFAMVRRTVDSQLVQLRAGDRVEGLTVSAIEPHRVVLAGAAQAIVMEADPEPAWAGDPAPFGH